MAILIKDMEMPKRCADCWLMDSEDSWCCARRGKALSADYRYGIKDRPSWCPLVQLPPHGRLIDLDDYVKAINDRIDAAIKWGTNAIADGNQEIKTRAEQAVATFCEASLTARKMPTIIEAEGVRE